MAAAPSCGRQPADFNAYIRKAPKGRKQAARCGIAAAASRLSNLLWAIFRGLTPRLRATVPSGLRKCATSKSVSEGEFRTSLAEASGYELSRIAANSTVQPARGRQSKKIAKSKPYEFYEIPRRILEVFARKSNNQPKFARRMTTNSRGVRSAAWE